MKLLPTFPPPPSLVDRCARGRRVECRSLACVFQPPIARELACCRNTGVIHPDGIVGRAAIGSRTGFDEGDGSLAAMAGRIPRPHERGPDDPRRVALLNDGLARAEQRRTHMTQLIRENPQQALQEALRFDEYFALPESIRSRVERPFSERAGYTYLPVCAGPDGRAPITGVDHIAELSLPTAQAPRRSPSGGARR